ncbi:MAG: hypothetical protein J7M15_05855 [Anaerolineae bacterium]|nr:hypothetical protein [Anaerolineae bacterium]
MSIIRDPDVRMLASIAEALRGDYVNREQEAQWAGSPFDWIRKTSSRRKGKIGEQLVAGWCAAKGFSVSASGDSEADRVIVGFRTEIKLSTLWGNGGFKYQQIRDQEYDIAICLGIMPFDARCWILPKKVLYENVIGHTLQHMGRYGSDTFWIAVENPDRLPRWMSPYGGRLSEAFAVLRHLKQSSPQ